MAAFFGTNYLSAMRIEQSAYAPEQAFLLRRMRSELEELALDGLDATKVINFIAKHNVTEFKQTAKALLEGLCQKVGLTLNSAVELAAKLQNQRMFNHRPSWAPGPR